MMNPYWTTRSVDSGIFGNRAAALGEYIGPGAAPPVHAYDDGVLGEYFRGGGLAPAAATRDGIFGGGLGAVHVPGLGYTWTDADVAIGGVLAVLIRGLAGGAVGAAVAPRGETTGWIIGGALATILLREIGVGATAAIALAARK